MFRRNFIFLLIFVCLFVIYAFLVSAVDMKYQVDKKEFIVNNYETFFRIDRRSILRTIDRYLNKKTAIKSVDQVFLSIVNSPHQCVYKMVAYDADNQIITSHQNLEKVRKNNTIHSALIYQKFSGSYTFSEDSLHYKVECTYTTPASSSELAAMTHYYWRYVIALTIVFMVVSSFILKYHILPVKRVINGLLQLPEGKSRLIRKPIGQLEKSFNLVLFYSELIQFTNRIYEQILQDKDLTSEVALDRIVERKLAAMLSCDEVMIWRGKETEKSFPLSGLLKDSDLLERIVPSFQPGNQYLGIRVEMTDETLFCLAAYSKIDPTRTFLDYPDMIQRLEQILSIAYNYFRLKKSTIIEEKNRSNVNLAKNLGHDLTNILATAKLELSNLRLLQKMSASALDEDIAQNLQIVMESLSQNFNFLQEIVNIYRSIGYMHQPKYQNFDLCELVNTIWELYIRSTSQKIEWKKAIPEEGIMMYGEPHLLKLAFFNLLANAYEAAKEIQSDHYQPCIHVKVYVNDGQICVSVEDNGTGICAHNGELLAPDQMDQIFDFGYTTKKKENGEGLGLSWVKTIVNQFHDGRIFAVNVPSSGARFVMEFHTQIKEDSDKGV